MKTVGDILKTARIKQGLSYAQVSQRTKIHPKYLKALEQNQYDQLPASAFTKGFIRNYAKVVRLNPETILAIFRRDYDHDEKGRIIPRGATEPITRPKQVFNPKTTSIFISSIAIALICIFFVRQIINFSSAPSLEISTPDPNSQVVSPVNVSGTTNPQATLTVNNRPITVDSQGNFNAQLPLSPGQHTLVVVAENRSNKQTIKDIIIYVSSPD